MRDEDHNVDAVVELDTSESLLVACNLNQQLKAGFFIFDKGIPTKFVLKNINSDKDEDCIDGQHLKHRIQGM